MKVYVRNMSETELQKEASRLRLLIRNHEATIGEAERLADIERMLKRIQAVRDGKAW